MKNKLWVILTHGHVTMSFPDVMGNRLKFVREVEIFPKSYKLSNLEDDPIVWELNQGQIRVVRVRLGGRIFFKSPTLTA